MSDQPVDEASTIHVFLKAGIPAIVTCSLIPLTFVIPLIDSTRAPYFDLTRPFAEVAYWFAESGGLNGAPIVLALMLLVLATRGSITRARRINEIGIILFVVGIFAWGIAAINENVVKEQLKVPRPDIVLLAGNNGGGTLEMTPDEFYELGDKDARSGWLAIVLNKERSPVSLSPVIKAHWIKETGYSFPSGHAFSAMFFATFLLSLGATYLTTRRLWIFYALLPWALAVCYSRPILRVHTPADITVGGLQGLAVGFMAWALARSLIRRFA